MPIENPPVWLEAYTQNRQRMEKEKKDMRGDWSESDWKRAVRDALKPQSRHGTSPGDWEYLVKGDWVNQQTYDDPMWRKNVYAPWQQEVQDQWSVAREETENWRRKNRYAGYNIDSFKPKQKGFRRGPTMGSRSSGGGGNIDPAILDALMSGG